MAKLENLMAKLNKLDGVVTHDFDPFSMVIQTPSPSLNFTFGNTHGLPIGFSMVLYGPPRGGKSVIANMMIGKLHQDYPDAVAVKFDTEFRERGQVNAKHLEAYGIDKSRYTAFEVNRPDEVFDRIEKDIVPLIQDGLNVRLVVIDSISGISGRRALNADTIMTQQIGDHAMTIQEGFKRILPLQRKYNFAVILTAHVRAEMDIGEQMRGNKVKMNASFGVKHYAEYYMYTEPLLSKEGKADLLGKKFENEDMTDMGDKGERTGHKVRVVMKDSSLGPKGRTGLFTLSYADGSPKIINTHEEVFTLGVNRGIIEKPNNVSYAFGDKKWHGKPAILEAIRLDKSLYHDILLELRKRDIEGKLVDQDPERGLAVED